MPNGQMLPHLSARMRTETMDAVFADLGGAQRLADWARASDENYGAFFQAWARGAVRSTNIELTADDSIEGLLDRLDAGEHAKVISPDNPDGK
jgi:hypothetical protein